MKQKSFTFSRFEIETPVLGPALQSNQSSLCGLHRSDDRGGGRLNTQVVSIKRADDGRRQRSREIIDEKFRAKNGSLRNTSTDWKETIFVILINHSSAPIKKGRFSPTSKAKREASQNEFIEKGGVLNRVQSFQEINSGENCPRAQLG